MDEGKAYNPYFPGGVISMPQQLYDEGIDYKDGTPATQSQQVHHWYYLLTVSSDYKKYEVTSSQRFRLLPVWMFQFLNCFINRKPYNRWLLEIEIHNVEFSIIFKLKFCVKNIIQIEVREFAGERCGDIHALGSGAIPWHTQEMGSQGWSSLSLNCRHLAIERSPMNSFYFSAGSLITIRRLRSRLR